MPHGQEGFPPAIRGVLPLFSFSFSFWGPWAPPDRILGPLLSLKRRFSWEPPKVAWLQPKPLCLGNNNWCPKRPFFPSPGRGLSRCRECSTSRAKGRIGGTPHPPILLGEARLFGCRIWGRMFYFHHNHQSHRQGKHIHPVYSVSPS